ncbi:MAG: radical SAM protein, partial [Eubacteriales bacterium]
MDIDKGLDAKLEHISNRHPCFSKGAHFNKGRVHLPVSPTCNIGCGFCSRVINKAEQRPGVTAKLLNPQEAAALVNRALELCPEITVAGIAGPGDTLATPYAIQTFRLIHQEHPELINCLSTNGLLLEKYADDLAEVGVKTLTVTVNAVDPEILQKINKFVLLDGKKYEGRRAAEILIEAQEKGIRKMSGYDCIIKINIVLIPGVNNGHIGDIAKAVHEWGASLINIIPLIPQNEFAETSAPTCDQLFDAREAAEKHLPVFRHCQHCRADACGVPG